MLSSCSIGNLAPVFEFSGPDVIPVGYNLTKDNWPWPLSPLEIPRVATDEKKGNSHYVVFPQYLIMCWVPNMYQLI